MNDFFGLFAGLNGAYAGSERFRDSVDYNVFRILQIQTSIIEKIEESQAKVLLLQTNIRDAMQVRADAFATESTESLNILETSRKQDEGYKESFKVVFWITALYSMFMIIFSGYECLLSQEQCSQILFFMNLTLLFNIGVYIKTLLRPDSANPNSVKTTSIFFGWFR